MARSKSNFSEYTRLRDIVVKRNKRAYEAGLMPLVHFPTVKEIKSGMVSASEARRYVEEYYSSGSQVRAIRETGFTPEVKRFQELPKSNKSEAEKKKERKRKQKQYRQNARVRANAPSVEKGEQYQRYLKAARTFAKKFISAGMKPPFNPDEMTPKEAQAFTEYMEYRFSQADYNQLYVIDEFIADYARLRVKHKPEDIVKDFEKFLDNRQELENREDAMQGLSGEDFNDLWYKLSIKQ